MKMNVETPALSGLSRLALATVMLGSVAAAPAVAQTLRHAVGLPETSYNYDAAVAFGEAIEENTDLEMKVFALSLLSLNEISGGVRDGLADTGFTLFPYFPAEYSEMNLPADLSLLAISDPDTKWPGPAVIGASMEYIMLNCTDCQEQLKGLNAVYLNGAAAVEYGMVCNKPVTSIADLEGLKVRTGAADQGRFADYFGAVRVALSGNEIYDALSTGNVDCSFNQGENLVGLRYIEIADHFNPAIMGSMFAGLATTMNRDTWQDMSEENRRGILTAAAVQPIVSWILNKERNISAVEEFRAAGKNVYDISAEDQAKIAEFIAQDLDVVRAEYNEKYGLEDVDGKIETITALIEKWKGLTNEIDVMEQEPFIQLYLDEIMSKVDVSTYGMD
ncbi:C4-dicarboxylate TRAP transporter substrate-binding protein [Maritimibacter sp. UBA3975]|uniref:C4-dicarboxylate TRAP transporter substrate-binding protein n=1 Tax=Maritimibacter sp. UBA3975 TaxID=1946833 RepID=UPI000C08F85E|nr:C4-dicarboxylate TRAP transporter substrate-binding protein [Maritimibacter sp. UBA3975]MAM61284.1 hypothetical protein [Maritimibacter sp.]|tara:strand:- start:5986 stop:7155 length:1170 start_codon:yes stop_codon:yes gene_type:complete